MVLLFRTGKFSHNQYSKQGFNLLTVGKPRGYTLVQLVELVMGLLYI